MVETRAALEKRAKDQREMLDEMQDFFGPHCWNFVSFDCNQRDVMLRLQSQIDNARKERQRKGKTNG